MPRRFGTALTSIAVGCAKKGGEPIGFRLNRRLGLLRRALSGTVHDLALWNQNFESGVLGGTDGVRFVQFEYDKVGTMKTTIFLRIAAVLTLIHSILHTVGDVFGKPLPGAAEQAVAAMKANHFMLMGVLAPIGISTWALAWASPSF